jgi:Ca-activated chloride channel family protein
VSFAAPLVLLALLVLPLLGAWYLGEQDRRRRAAVAFATEPLTPSVAPHRPGWRRHVPYALFALALAALIFAAARPRHTVTVPVKGGTVMFANDVSDSMQATDVKPSRLGAAKRAALSFVNAVSPSIELGSIEFARTPVLLQPPTSDHRLTRTAIAQLKPGGGGTAIGEALLTALREIAAAPKIDGKHPPGAVILISDGTSNVGVSPIAVARAARQRHVKIYTVSIGTTAGTIKVKRGGRDVTSAVPVNPSELGQIAATSGGQAFRAADSAAAQTIYSHLAKRLGHRRANRGLVAVFAGAGLVLLCAGLAASLLWFGRLT